MEIAPSASQAFHLSQLQKTAQCRAQSCVQSASDLDILVPAEEEPRGAYSSAMSCAAAVLIRRYSHDFYRLQSAQESGQLSCHSAADVQASIHSVGCCTRISVRCRVRD